MNKDFIELDGIIKDCLPNTKFKVELDLENGKTKKIIAYLSGKMRKHFIKIVVGDKVRVEMSPYDLNKGRIIYRYK